MDILDLKLLFVLTATRFLDRNSRWNHKYYSARKDACTTYSYDNWRHFWIQETPVSPESLIHYDP